MTHSIDFKATDELLALFTAQQAEGVESPLASIKVAIADETLARFSKDGLSSMQNVDISFEICVSESTSRLPLQPLQPKTCLL